MSFFEDYDAHVAQRAKLGVPPLPLSASQTQEICELLRNNHEQSAKLVSMLQNRVSPGVDDAAKVKAEFLNEILNHSLKIDAISPEKAVEMLKTMLGGYNVIVLIACLQNSDEKIATLASNALKNIIFVHDYFNDVAKLAKTNKFAKAVIQSWADAEWFLNKPKIPEKIENVYNLL